MSLKSKFFDLIFNNSLYAFNIFSTYCIFSLVFILTLSRLPNNKVIVTFSLVKSNNLDSVSVDVAGGIADGIDIFLDGSDSSDIFLDGSDSSDSSLFFLFSYFTDFLRDHNSSFVFNIGLVLFRNVNTILSKFNSNINDNIKHGIIMLVV